jgi:hypothetical protein
MWQMVLDLYLSWQFRSGGVIATTTVTGLCTNFSKSHVVPIRCNNIDLDDVL